MSNPREILKVADLADIFARLAKGTQQDAERLAAEWGAANGYYGLNVACLRRLEAFRAAREASRD